MYNTIDNLKREYEDKIYVLRNSILRMVPEEFQNILDEYLSCTTNQKLFKYIYGSIEKIIEKVVETIEHNENEAPQFIDDWQPDRVYCPLCKEGNLNGTGLTIPIGLERHLKGYGNIQQCIATEAAFDLARDYYNSYYRDKESEKKADELEKRKNSETLFLLNPNDNPELIDSGLYFNGHRDPENLKWAFDRLGKMGFLKIKENNVISFQKEYNNYVMFGDPRENKRLTFNVFIKPDTTLNKNKTKFKRLFGSDFYILDSWTKDLDKKIDDRFNKLVMKKIKK